MELSDFQFCQLEESINLDSFNCGEDKSDKDINEFLKEDALDYQNQRFANTYLFLDDNNDVAVFFSISNDCLNDEGNNRFPNNIWNRFHRRNSIPNSKRIKQYPAVKIGRLGVSKKYQGLKLGNQLLEFIKGWSLLEHKPACRLLLLDAINKPKQISYYTKNDFIFLDENDLDQKTRIMYFDMFRLS